jgi:hypothetical protein
MITRGVNGCTEFVYFLMRLNSLRAQSNVHLRWLMEEQIHYRHNDSSVEWTPRRCSGQCKIFYIVSCAGSDGFPVGPGLSMALWNPVLSFAKFGYVCRHPRFDELSRPFGVATQQSHGRARNYLSLGC